MSKISVYFRDEKMDWETMNVSFDPWAYNKNLRRRIIELGCHYDLYGNAAISRGIDLFLSSKLVKEYAFDATGASRYFYIMRKEEDF